MDKMIGKTPIEILQSEDEITFTFSDGTSCKFHHVQDCCEGVWVDDVNGDWSDLIGHPLTVADERIGDYDDGKLHDSVTWTFYTFRGIGGSVDVRWFGESNGHYSESVDMFWLD